MALRSLWVQSSLQWTGASNKSVSSARLLTRKSINYGVNGTYLSRAGFLEDALDFLAMTTISSFRFAAVVAGCAVFNLTAQARTAGPPAASAEEFVQTCATRLDLSEAQRTGLRAYLEQEIEYMAVQNANHSPTEVAELIPTEREQLQRVAGHLLSPGQLRQFRELEATPKMKDYLKQMSLEN